MMKRLTRFLALMLALLLPMTLAAAETEDPVIAMVNGEPLYYSEYYAVESAYIYQYQAAGVDLTDPTTYAYVQDLALTYIIEQRLVVQDMKAQGCFDFDAETEAWCAEQGKLAWDAALADVGEMLRGSLGLLEDEDVTSYALSYAEALGVNEQTYVDEYRMQMALVNYYDWLIRDNPITDEAVQTAYEERVAASSAQYGSDVAAFENAVSAGGEVWYMPAGYRSVLQILLPVEGETDAERLANAEATTDEIYARLEAGEEFTALIAEYGADANFEDESFYNSGYQVHRESVMWEDAFIAAAFSEEMAAPGCWSQPFASTLGVHILYYLGDVPGGPVELTEDVHDALAYVLYTERTDAALTERIEVLADEAEIVFY